MQELKVLQDFLKMPVGKILIVLLLLPSGVFGWLWYDNQRIILTQQKECNEKTERIYQYFLKKTEELIEKERKSNETKK